MEYETIRVVQVELKEELIDEKLMPLLDYSITDMLEFLAGLPLKTQLYMLCNLLTISGFSQREIAESLDINYKTYRNTLLDIRHKLKDNQREF